MKDILAYIFLAVGLAMGALFLGAALANAAPYTVVFKNKCADIVPEAPDWSCLNKSQGSQRGETIRQIELALKKTKFKKKIKIISVDPIRGKGEYTFGAWIRNGKMYFANMPGCPNARWELEKLLKRLK